MIPTIELVTTPAEKRQIARIMEFEPAHAPYIAFDKIAQTARELGAHFEVRYGQDGGACVTMFWSYTDEEAR